MDRLFIKSPASALADEETDILIDSLMVSVGSTNFDPRSFHLNDEANLNIYAADFARLQVDVFNADLSLSRRANSRSDVWQRTDASLTDF